MENIKNKNKSDFYSKLSAAVVIIGILLRIYFSFVHTISGDSCWHYTASKFISNEHRFPLFEQVGRDEPFWPPPLFHIIAAFFYSIFAESGLKLVPLIFGSLALVFSRKLFRKVLDERATFYSMLFLTFIPLSIDYSVLGYTESLLPFFTATSIYFALDKKFVLSSVIAGLGVLAKYNGVFLIPVLLYLAYTKSERKDRTKNLLIVCIVPMLVGLPWFIRNFLELGNPLWPFLNFLFKGYLGSPRGSYSSISLANLTSFATYVSVYIGFFGIPDGIYSLLFFYKIPFINILIALFFAGTLVFTGPLFFGSSKNKNKNKKAFYVLLGSFFVMFLIYEINATAEVSRIMLPVLIGAAFFYGIAMDKILSRFATFSKLINIILAVALFAFASA